MNPGPLEILIIAVFALLIFGPKKLPELSRTVGRALAEFRRATKEFSDELTSAVEDESKTAPDSPPRPHMQTTLPRPGPKPEPTPGSERESSGRSD